MLNNKLQRLLDGTLAVHVSDEGTFDKLMKLFKGHNETIGPNGDPLEESPSSVFSNIFGKYHVGMGMQYGSEYDTLPVEELSLEDFESSLDTSVYDASVLLPGDIILSDGDEYMVAKDTNKIVNIDDIAAIYNVKYININSVIRPDNLALYLQDKPTQITTIFQSVPTPRLVDTSEIEQEINDTISKLESLKVKLRETQE